MKKKRSKKAKGESGLKKIIVDNGLLLVFVGLFVVCMAGTVLAGKAQYNESNGAALSAWQFVQTGSFLQAIFANWQAAILQLGALIIFGVFLRQWGAPHSIKPQGFAGKSEASAKTQGNAEKSHSTAQAHSARREPSRGWWHDNSMSIAFVGLFALAFVAHVYSGLARFNSRRAFSHQPTLPLHSFIASSTFWFATLQTWEAEFAVMALYIFLSIFLRQRGSPESKPPEAPDSDTGDANK